MELQNFIQNIVDLFDDIDTSNFLVLSVIAMVDEEYGIIITSDDIRQAKTIEDLYSIVKSKQ